MLAGSFCAKASLKGLSLLTRKTPFYQRTVLIRHASSSSSKRWQTRQEKDRYVTEAKVQNLKSRAAFKLLEVWDYRLDHLLVLIEQPRSMRNIRSFRAARQLLI